ncbi:pyridoxal 5'-phosphate synthase glutaminase subunit PdxT [Canibacter zhoujuaniae]|uniref:pyridoxal 5'-phosphate synthase glutaminase subunit PdxT n=1 Tax=Canibacter zhoujuaniae TaxID=2708343 RepID=UPI00142377D4|nr:pyridoxal 5'-phosphate synthase glutaminase subunit PdxT [Canibacter zhoujuaniae]
MVAGAESTTAASTLLIGVLALQGGVEEHIAVLTELGIATRRVRRPLDLAELDGIIIPGGESTVIDKLARSFGLAEPLKNAITDGLPVFATCAGLIYLAQNIEGKAPGQETLGVLPVTVRRNAFGRQTESFETSLVVDDLEVPATFIRAPEVVSVAPGVETIAQLPGGRVVGVRAGNITAFSFHPEVDRDARLHQQWVARIPRK